MIVDADVLAHQRLTAGLPAPLRARVAAALAPIHLPGGRWLFHQGDPGDALYLVVSGRLEVVRSDPGRAEEQVVRLLQPGDSVGELALLRGGVRAAGVRAVRDSDLLVLHQRDLAGLMAHPEVAAALLAHVTELLQAGPPHPDPAGRRTVAAVLAVDPSAAAALAAQLHQSLLAQGIDAAVLREGDVDPSGADLRGGVSRRLGELESRHEVVVLDGGGLATPWSRVCARQADRVVVVPAADGMPGTGPGGGAWPDLTGCDLVVPHDRPPAAHRLDALDAQLRPRSHVRIRDAHRRGDIARLARRLAGRSLGLVLSGGGARGLAHIGVLHALADAGLVVDRYGGTSMGAFVSALAAAGRPPDAIERLVRREVVRRRPFADYTLPRRALIRGAAAERMLQHVLGAADVRHLAHPWFGVSAGLYDAELVVHRDGPTWEAVACSMSLPGLAPARTWRGRVVVDGGVLDNLPIGVMAGAEEGRVIAVDLTRSRARPLAAPGLVQTLGQTMTLSSLQQVARNRELADLCIDPDVGAVELLDWHRVDEAIAAGRAAAEAALDAAEPPAGSLPRDPAPR